MEFLIKKQSDKNNNKTNHKYLCYTILLLIISILYFIFNLQEEKETPFFEYILALLLIIIIIFSQFFWNNPIKNSIMHKIDAITAKIGILSFIFYTLIYKFKTSYLLVLLGLCISFYFSNKYSTQEWCCNKHILCHGLLHICCFIGSLYAFHTI
jgi:hypothetical protein